MRPWSQQSGDQPYVPQTVRRDGCAQGHHHDRGVSAARVGAGTRSRHYLLKFLARPGYTFRDGDNWTPRHFTWICRLLSDGSLIEEDHLVVSHYLALLEFKLQQRNEIPPEVIAYAWKAQMRLHKLYRRISERRNSRIAVVAGRFPVKLPA
jgi:hypothetical protein